MHEACGSGHAEIVELLLEKGAHIGVVNKVSDLLGRFCEDVFFFLNYWSVVEKR